MECGSGPRCATRERRARLWRWEFEQLVDERGVVAIHEIADLINERRTRAVMVSSATKRHFPAEAEARKAAYDEGYVRWNTKEDSILNEIQEFLAVAVPGGNRGYINGYAHRFRKLQDNTNSRPRAGPTRRETRSRPGAGRACWVKWINALRTPSMTTGAASPTIRNRRRQRSAHASSAIWMTA
jgi:hypothetical protein